MGCKSNQFEGSLIIENLVNNGWCQTDNLDDADIFLLNSCTVTHKSNNEAFYLLRNAKNKNITTVLTGCIAQIEKEKLLDYDFIDYVVGNDEKLNISEILADLNQNNRCFVKNIMELKDFHKVELTDTTKTRASLKIQDGCDNRCSYCIIPFARGKSRSADIDFILNQIDNFASKGFKETVYTRTHIGLWGKDLNLSLIDLLRAVETSPCKIRYRLGSLNPHEITDELLEFLKTSKKFCPHFHLSLQSACDKTLKSMNRFYKVDEYLQLIEKINQNFNLPFLGSDIIAGFAGEDDEDFATTCENLEKSGLSQIHTFPYSIREGTRGAMMTPQLPTEVKEKRADIIKEISRRKYSDFVMKNIGTQHKILVEKHPNKEGFIKGLTENYLKVTLNSKDLSYCNTIQDIVITEFKDEKIYGKLLD